MGSEGVDARIARLHLPPELSSAALARRFVADELRGTDVGVVEDAVLLVDELVANALLHAGTPIDVCLRRRHDRVRVEVWDGAAELPRPRVPATETAGGRGLQLVDLLADGGWGVDPQPEGKTVWFVLRTNGNARPT